MNSHAITPLSLCLRLCCVVAAGCGIPAYRLLGGCLVCVSMSLCSCDVPVRLVTRLYRLLVRSWCGCCHGCCLVFGTVVRM